VPGGRFLRVQFREIARAGRGKVDGREHPLRIELAKEIAHRLACGGLQGPGSRQIKGVLTGDTGGKQIKPEEGKHRHEYQK